MKEYKQNMAPVIPNLSQVYIKLSRGRKQPERIKLQLNALHR